MNTNDQSPEFEFRGNRAQQEFESLKNSEAFARMAEELAENKHQDDEQVSLKQTDINMMDIIKEKETQQSKAQESNSLLNMGPKYMTAIDNMLSIADVRSIETELPILKTSVEISPLTGQEEQALKSASVSPEGFLKKVDELLFGHSKFKDIEFKSYHEFLANLYPPDKSVMMWALLTASYMVLPTMEKKCGSCSKTFIIDGKPGDIIHEDSITKSWDKNIPPSEYTEAQTVLNGTLTFEIGMPSEKDKLIITKLIKPNQAKDNLESEGDILSYNNNLAFFSKAIAVESPGTEKIVMTDTIGDIYPFLENLPPKITDAIKSGIDLSIFDDLMPKFYLNTKCDHCGHDESINVDPEISFFRKAISL